MSGRVALRSLHSARSGIFLLPIHYLLRLLWRMCQPYLRIATFGQNKPRCTGLVKNKKVTFLSYFLKFGIEFCGVGEGGDGIMGKGRCLGESKGRVE